jgi:hypothetical protein
MGGSWGGVDNATGIALIRAAKVETRMLYKAVEFKVLFDNR